MIEVVIYCIFVTFIIGFVCYINHKGEWFIMDIMEIVVCLISGILVGIIIGLQISNY